MPVSCKILFVSWFREVHSCSPGKAKYTWVLTVWYGFNSIYIERRGWWDDINCIHLFGLVLSNSFLVCLFFFFFERACCDAHFPQGVGPFRVLTQTLCPLGLTQTLCPGHWAAAAARTLQNLRNAIVFMGISNSERYLADLTGFWKLPKAIWWKWAEWGGWYSREMLGEGKGRLRHGYKIGPWTGVA